MMTFAVVISVMVVQEEGLAREATALAEQYRKAQAWDEALLLLGIAKDDAAISALKPGATKAASDAPIRALGRAWSARAAARAKAEKDREKRLWLEARAEVLADLGVHLAAFRKINAIRRAAGVPVVAWDLDLATGAQLHARYLVAHPDDGHDEKSTATEHTEAGAAAGRQSGLSHGEDVVAAVDGLMSTLYHRIGFLDPGWKKAGTGQKRGGDSGVVSAVNHYGAHEFTSERKAVAWPPAGAKDLPVRFQDESPDPVPGDDPAGYPVTLTFFGGGTITKARGRLTENGRDVPCWVTSPADPARKDRPENARSICLIPKAPLKARATYTVKIEAVVDGEPMTKEWSFTTTPTARR